MIEKNFYKHRESNDDGVNMKESFNKPKKVAYTEMPSTRLVDKIFDRFNVEPADKNCILAHEFLVAMIIICQITNDIKIKMLFMLYDDHNRNFLESKALLNLMETIEKLFAKEK